MNIINSNQLNNSNDINENSQENKSKNDEVNSNNDSSFDEFDDRISNIRTLIGNLNKKNNDSFVEDEEGNNTKIKNLINSINERDYIIQEFENLFKEIFEQTLFYKTQNTDLKLFPKICLTHSESGLVFKSPQIIILFILYCFIKVSLAKL